MKIDSHGYAVTGYVCSICHHPINKAALDSLGGHPWCIPAHQLCEQERKRGQLID